MKKETEKKRNLLKKILLFVLLFLIIIHNGNINFNCIEKKSFSKKPLRPHKELRDSSVIILL